MFSPSGRSRLRHNQAVIGSKRERWLIKAGSFILRAIQLGLNEPQSGGNVSLGSGRIQSRGLIHQHDNSPQDALGLL